MSQVYSSRYLTPRFFLAATFHPSCFKPGAIAFLFLALVLGANTLHAQNPTTIPGFTLGPTHQTAPIPTGVATGDFNRDGNVDWVVASGEGTLWLYLGNGDGTAQRPRAIWPGGKYKGPQQMAGKPGLHPVPISVAAADLRNNGVYDLVVTEGSENRTIAVMLGNGNGTFQPAVRYRTRETGAYLRIADLNNDGFRDLVIGRLNGGLEVRIGDGSGSFSDDPLDQPPNGLESGPPPPDPDNYIDGLTSILDVGDYDHDGILDLVYAGSGGAWVLQGIGNGQFNARQRLLSQTTCAHSCLYYAAAAAFVDADADGYLDFVVVDSLGTAYVHRNRQDGTFETERSSFVPGAVPADISVADVNGDGHLDVLTSSMLFLINPVYGQAASNILSVAYGDGQGAFPMVRTFRGGTSMVSLAVADLNKDGFPEVLTADQISGTYSLFKNDGQGGFGWPQGAVPVEFGKTTTYWRGAVGDVDGDGRADMVVLTSGHNASLYTLLGDDNGELVKHSGVPLPEFDFPQDLALADFRHTGRADAVMSLARENKIYFAPSLGGGAFGSALEVGDWRAPMLTAADFNQDGTLDLVTADTGRIDVALGTGNGSFFAHASYAFTDPGGGTPSLLEVRDYNADGRSDILVWTQSSTEPGHGPLVLFIGNGNGTFQPARQLFGSIGPCKVADLNHDGLPDLISFARDTAILTVYRGQPNGIFQAVNSYTPIPGGKPASSPILYSPPLVGDFDGDGNVDVLIRQRSTSKPGYFLILRGNGDLSFTVINRVYTTSTTPEMFVTDWNHDGRSDLVEWYDYSASFLILPGAALPPGLELSFAGSSRIGTSLDLASHSESVTLTASPSSVVVPAVVPFPNGSSYQEFMLALNANHDPADVFQITGQLGMSDAQLYGSIPFNPIPRLGILGIAIPVAGDPGFPLTLNGADFVPGAVVLFDGNVRATRYLDSTKVEFDLTNQDLAAGGSHQISVRNPGPGGGESNSENFLVQTNPVFISGLSPERALAGGQGLVLTIFGGIFTQNTVVRWDGNIRPALFVNQNQLTISLNATETAAAAQHTVVVFDPRNGGLTSNTIIFSVVNNTPPRGEVEAFGSDFNGSHTIGAHAPFFLKGWVGDDEDNSSLGVLLRLNGSNFGGASAGLDRPDIAARFNRSDWAKSGFSIFNCCLSVGTYTLQVLAKDRDGAQVELPFLNGSNVITVVNSPRATGQLERVVGSNGTLTVSQNSTVFVSGWATIENTGQAPAGVRVYFNDVLHPVGDAQIGVVRPDLVASTGNQNLLNSGFAFQFNIGNASIGPHYVMAQAFNSVGDVTMLGFSTGTGGVLINVVAPSGAGSQPGIATTSSSLSFAPQPIGSVSESKSITITNNGAATLNLFGITATGDYTQTNNCGALTVAASCTVSVTFRPVGSGNRQGALTIYSNASTGPSTISLSGTGVGAALLVSVNSLTFSPRFVGTSSAVQSVVLTSIGTTALTFANMSTSGDFGKTSTCGPSLSPGASCTVSITFTPASWGARSGILQITTNAAESIRTVQLSGVGQDLVLSPAPNSTTTATVTAGQMAIYNLMLSPQGKLSEVVNLGCAHLPPRTTCSFSQTTAILTNPDNINITFALTTTGQKPSAGLRTSPPPSSFPTAPYYVMATTLMAAFGVNRYHRACRHFVRAITLGLLMLIIGCGGGSVPAPGASSLPQQPTTPPATVTPPGVYSVTVTASNANVTRMITLSLTVN